MVIGKFGAVRYVDLVNVDTCDYMVSKKKITSVDSIANFIRTKQMCLSFGKLATSKAATDFPKFWFFTWNFKFYHSQHILPGLFLKWQTCFVYSPEGVYQIQSLKNHRCLSVVLLSENSVPFKKGESSSPLISQAMFLGHARVGGQHWGFLYNPTAPHRTLFAKVEL